MSKYFYKVKIIEEFPLCFFMISVGGRRRWVSVLKEHITRCRIIFWYREAVAPSQNRTERNEKILLKDFFDDRDPVFSVYGSPVHDDKIEETAETMNAAVCGKGDHSCGPCDCKQKTSTENQAINSLPLAMAYVPMQAFRCLYSPEQALESGTLFKELDLPFLGGCQGRERR